MSWIDLLGQVAGLRGVYGEAGSYLRGQIITAAVRGGASANSILRALSSNGLGVRRQQALDLVANEQRRQRSASTVSQIPWGVADEVAAGIAPANWTGQYVHQVQAVYRTRDEAGNYMLHTRTMGIRSGSLLTPADASQAALNIMSTAREAEATEGNYPEAGQVLTVSLSGVWYDTQGRALPTV